jgi:CO dehydrogenase/acetyl-CoA synthase beta subunit
MNSFNSYFQSIKDYIGGLRGKDRAVRVWFADRSAVAVNSPAESRWPRVLKEDTAVELGGPLSAGTIFFLCGDDVSLIADGRITLVGADIIETTEKILPFGQVVLVAGPTLTKGITPELENELYTAARVPGYMLRSTGGHIWSRLSHQAVSDGFSLKLLGRAILSHISANLASASAAEVLFVTSSVGDVQELDKIGILVRSLAHDLRRERIKQATGEEFECESDGDCDICPNSAIHSQCGDRG